MSFEKAPPEPTRAATKALPEPERISSTLIVTLDGIVRKDGNSAGGAGGAAGLGPEQSAIKLKERRINAHFVSLKEFMFISFKASVVEAEEEVVVAAADSHRYRSRQHK